MKRIIEVALIGSFWVGSVAWACLPDRAEIWYLQAVEAEIDGVPQDDLTPWTEASHVRAGWVHEPDRTLYIGGEGIGFTEDDGKWPLWRPL